MYICLSKSFINISVDFLADLFKPSNFLSSFLVWTLKGPPDLKFWLNWSIPLSIDVFIFKPYSENFQRSDLGIPAFVSPLSMFWDTNLSVCGKPVFSLASNLEAPVKTGSTTSVAASPTTLDAPLNVGPTKVNAPKNAVPSAPNFNLFLNTAAAYSFGSLIPSKLSSLVFAKALSKTFPSSSPNTSPTLLCPVADTAVSATNPGNTQ